MKDIAVNTITLSPYRAVIFKSLVSGGWGFYSKVMNDQDETIYLSKFCQTLEAATKNATEEMERRIKLLNY